MNLKTRATIIQILRAQMDWKLKEIEDLEEAIADITGLTSSPRSAKNEKRAVVRETRSYGELALDLINKNADEPQTTKSLVDHIVRHLPRAKPASVRASLYRSKLIRALGEGKWGRA